MKIAKKVDPGKTWEESILVDTAELEKSSYESLAKGEVTPLVMTAFLFRVMFGPPEYGCRFTKTDNELLGVKGRITAQDFKQATSENRKAAVELEEAARETKDLPRWQNGSSEG